MRTIDMQNRKPYLVTALVFLIIGICIALPIEYKKAMLIVDFPYTAISLGIAIYSACIALWAIGYLEVWAFSF